MKVGILGGTFNPIHTGHLILAENAYDYMHLDRVLFVPSGISYLKDQSEILPAYHRVEMVRRAIANNPHFAVSTIETEREGNSYTYETLETMKRENPEDELFFIGGADILMTIHTWNEPGRILKNAKLVIAPRNDTPMEELEAQKKMLQERFCATVHLLHTTDLEISSSDIRERIENGHSVRYYIPDIVVDYIKEHKLYGLT